MSEATVLALIAGRDPDEHPEDGHVAYVRSHARAAIRAGYEPQLMCVGRTPSVRETEIGTIRRAFSPSRRPRPLWIPLHGPPLVREVVALARERPGPLLVHGFGTWSWAGVRACARLRAQGKRAVAVASAYDTYPTAKAEDADGVGPGAGAMVILRFRAEAVWSRAVIARYEGHAYHNVAAVFVNYQSVRRMIVADYGAQVPVRFLPYAPELDFRPASSTDGQPMPAAMPELRPADAPLVLCISFHRPHKGVDVLIDALALARDRGTPLRACIVGMGPLVETHRRRARQAGLAGATAVIGAVDDVEPYLRAADIYVLPSRSEQSGSIALLEAMRAGIPAVASRVDGIPEDVEDEVNALLVTPGNPGDLADALVRLAHDAGLRARIGEAGRRRFEERFSADAFSAALGEAYAELGFAPDRTREVTPS